MDIVYKLLIVSLLLVINSKTNEANINKIENYTKYWKDPHPTYYITGRNIITSDFSTTYAACKFDSEINNKEMDKTRCNITISTPVDKDKSEEKKCYIDFLDRDPSIGHVAIYDLRQFGDNKVIFSWGSISKPIDNVVRVSVLYIKNCKFYHYQKYGDTFFLPILSENTFDIVFSDKSMCDGLDNCRISYNEFGRQVGKILPFSLRMKFGFIDIEPKTNGVYVYGLDDDFNLGMDYVSHDGKLTKFMANVVLPQSDIMDKQAYSNVHNLHTMCWEQNHIHCVQFNEFGKVLLNVTLPNAETEHVKGVHNLVEGGIVVLISASKGGNDFYIRYVDSNEKIGESLGINFGCDDERSFTLNVFETSEFLRFYMLCSFSELNFSVQHVMKSDVIKST